MSDRYDTTAPQVIKELSGEILKSIKGLKEAVDDIEKVVKGRGERDAIPYGWIENAQIHFERIKGNICRINGAVLVRCNDKE